MLPDTRVLVLTASTDEDAVIRAVAAGATGYLQKYCSREKLLATLRDVAEGEFRVPAQAMRRVFTKGNRPLTIRNAIYGIQSHCLKVTFLHLGAHGFPL